MTRPAFVTIGTHDYAAQSLILARSIRRFHSEARTILFAVENNAHAELYGDAFDEIITAAEIGVPTLADMAFRYSQAELCFALKPWVLDYLLKRNKYDAIFYFDSDIEIFSPLKEAVNAITDGANLVLTPHVTVPTRPADHVNEDAVLKSGAYNAGFLAIATTVSAEQFLAWWASKTQADAGHDPLRGTYGDQKWLDLAPSLLDKVTILRHPGYNVAYWNCHLRAMIATPKGWTCNGQPLRFFHYSRWRMNAQPPDDYFREFFAPGSAFILPILRSYAERVAAEAPVPEDACSALATFHLPDGQVIPPIVKTAYARNAVSMPGTRERIVEISLERLNAPRKDWLLLGGQKVSVLFDWLWRSQTEEWRRGYDISTAAGFSAFKAWLRSAGAACYAIPSVYLGSLDAAPTIPAGRKIAAAHSDAPKRDHQMLLARILDLQVQLDRPKKASGAPLQSDVPAARSPRPSIWSIGLGFLRGAAGAQSTEDHDSSSGDAVHWGAGTIFREFFDRLDHTNIVDLASGSGHHAANLLKHYHPRSLTLVDDNQANIDSCKARFANRKGVTCLLDADNNLDAITNGSHSAVYSYGHLVGLEYDDVASCLMKIGRILAPGKHALLHHSVHDGQPGVAAADSHGGRSYMSEALFTHLCARAGLFVIERAKVGQFDGVALAQRVSPLE